MGALKALVLAALGAFVLGPLGCVEDVGPSPSIVLAPRVLAVISEPPETRTGETTTLSTLVATPEGTATPSSASWGFCTTPKPLTENNSVSSACFADAVAPIAGATAVVVATIPNPSCSLFGPDVPPDGTRPRDPDPTGGYFQPVRVDVAGISAIGEHRIVCNLASAPVNIAREYRERYVPNRNPAHFTVSFGDGEVRGSTDVTLTGSWDASDAETYVSFDVASQTLQTRRESMSLSWFTTAGTFADTVTGRGEDDPTLSSSNVWTTPPAGQTAYLWVVLRDGRGGTAVFSKSVRTVP
jgi:hypothetical protein